MGTLPPRGIPSARSKWEAGVRHIIGGGEVRNFRADNARYRGGGNLADAILLMACADDFSEFTTLRSLVSVDEAREILRLPSGLEVPDGAECCVMNQFNDDATAGPLLRAFGVKGKYGLKALVEGFVWDMYDAVGKGKLCVDQMPCLLARVGYRTKLVDLDVALKKIADMKPIGRAVMMLDATEQSFSSPLFNVISKIVTKLHSDGVSGWRNYLVRASTAWVDLWDEVKIAKTVVELDWSKFDRERPADDIQFFTDIVCSCFTPTSPRTERLLGAYKKMMENALVHRVMMLDDGCFFTLDGMVPSGSLWTGICDTALNIMYITTALRRLGFKDSSFVPKCAGDDNLTLFTRRVSREKLERLRISLNGMFRANIDKEDFIVHYPPYHVTTEQACFPPGTDLSRGTSSLLDNAEWRQFEGSCPINEALGKSHRWRYNFFAKPKFLANFFLPDGRPIRPARDNLEKLLWPEGLHSHIEDYEAAVLAMVVDNPFNHHNVNHMMHRFLIIQQIKRQAYDVDEALVMELAALRDPSGGVIPYPEIAFYRRMEGYVDIEAEPQFIPWLREFRGFVAAVSSLYARKAEGGIDAWRFMDIIRGEHSIGPGQFGNDVIEWCKFLGSNPLTRSLRATRRFKTRAEAPVADSDTLNQARAAFRWARELCQDNPLVTPLYFASRLSDVIQSS